MDVVNFADVTRADVSARKAEAPGAQIHCHLPDEALVRGDERLLGRLMANLLDNALKYGEGAPIELAARRANGGLHLTVESGGSLPTEWRARLFEPFFQGEGVAVGRDGFGLGLPFARAVARAHGGDLQVGDAAPGRTAFVLTLPLIDWSDDAPQGVALEDADHA
jgi:signal transduction histidine kinase